MRIRTSVAAGLAFIAAAVLPLPAVAGGVVENFDGVTAPALPTGWTSTVAAGPGSVLPAGTSGVGYASSTPNALLLNDVDAYADVNVISPTYQLAASGSPGISFHHSRVLWAPDQSALYNGVFSGAVFEISVNGGAFTDVVTAGGSFASGGYNVSLDPNFDNPVAPSAPLNRQVWGATSGGYVTTNVTLPATALGGTIAFRWRLGTEGGGRSYDTHSGWWIDDVRCSLCFPVGSDVIFRNNFD